MVNTKKPKTQHQTQNTKRKAEEEPTQVELECRTQKRRRREKTDQLKYTPETLELLCDEWRLSSWSSCSRSRIEWGLVSPCRPTPLPSVPPITACSWATYPTYEKARVTQGSKGLTTSSTHGACFGSVPLEIVLMVADYLTSTSLFSLLGTCRSIYGGFLHYSSIIKGKREKDLLLLFAVRSCKSKDVTMLIEDGADPNVRDTDDRHILHIAAQHLSYDIIPRLLRSTECNPNLRDRCGRTALHYAVMAHNIEKITWLLGYADPNVRSAGPGWTPLHYAVFKGYKDIVKLLCTHGACVNKTDASTRGTALHFAYRGRHNAELKQILCTLGANKKAVDFLGLTPPNYSRLRHRNAFERITGCDLMNFGFGFIDSWI